MDTTQILLTAVITIMTIMLTIIGIQLIAVLKDVRVFLKRVNTVSAELEKIGVSLGHGYSEVIGFVSGLKSLFFILNLLAKKKHKKHDKPSS